MTYKEKPQSRNPHRWVVFGVMSSVYFFVYFHRVSTSVIAPDLLATFQTHATALGFMSSMYFYLYAIEQPLVGYLSDALGPRRVVGLWSLIAVLGCVLFGLSPTIGWAAVGRGFIGFGVGGVYVPAMKALSRWFREKEFATMIGLLLACGNLGAILATTPLAWMASGWGWRSTFLIIGGVTLGLALATLLVVQDRDESIESAGRTPSLKDEKEQSKETRGSVIRILSSLRFWLLAALFAGAIGINFAFQGLWATPFIMSVLSLDTLRASEFNMLIPIGFVVGAPFSGWLTDRIFGSRVNMLMCLLVLMAGIYGVLTVAGHSLGKGGMVALLLVMGGTGGGFATNIWALVREITPGTILGLTSGLLNPFPLLGTAILQGWTGAILDRVGKMDSIYPAVAYRDIFILFLLIVVGCFILCAFLKRQLSREAA
jgi:sugar phosphate permease